MENDSNDKKPVFPKELRNRLHFGEDPTLEITIEDDGKITLKRVGVKDNEGGNENEENA